MAETNRVPEREDEGWMPVRAGSGGEVQVRKVGKDLYMVRHGTEGTAISLTKEQLDRLLEPKP